jgi:hypothetical protein
VVARNPYDRLVSAFVNKAVVFPQYYTVQDDVRTAVRLAAQRFGCSPDDVTFETFVTFLHQNRRYVEKETMWVHLCRQVYYKPSKFDRICRVENLKEDLAGAYSEIFRDSPEMKNKALSYIAELPMMNSTSKRPMVGTFHNVPIGTLRTMDVLPTNSNFLSPRVMNMIYEIYSQDFETFGYSRELPRPVENAYRLPADFDWREYLRLNPYIAAFGYNNKEIATYYYLHYGVGLKHRYKE